MPDWIILFSLVIPLIFSGVFFAIPLLRKPFVYVRNLRTKQKNKKSETFKKIFEKNGTNISPENNTEEKTFLALEGEATANNDGTITYFFEEINQEQKKL
jgi:hypothetical protein